ncbi:hypothetical protein EMIT0194MI4_150021 [Pseudomonas sp. IT-194MI4]
MDHFPLLWRGSLLPFGGAALAKPLPAVYLKIAAPGFRAAAQPSGSKLPRHKGNSDTLRAYRYQGETFVTTDLACQPKLLIMARPHAFKSYLCAACSPAVSLPCCYCSTRWSCSGL